MKGKIIIYAVLTGLVVGLIWIAFVHQEIYKNYNYASSLMWIRGISYFLHAFTIYWAIRLTRKDNNGEIAFGKAMFTGVIVSIIIGTSKGLVLTAFYSSGSPKIEEIKQFAHNYADEQYPLRMKELNEYFKNDSTKAKKEQVNLTEQYEMTKNLIDEQYSTKGGGLTASMQEALVLGFIISAIGAAVMQRKRRQA